MCEIMLNNQQGMGSIPQPDMPVWDYLLSAKIKIELLRSPGFRVGILTSDRLARQGLDSLEYPEWFRVMRK